jgi:sec-independent protein translocase protein TatC
MTLGMVYHEFHGFKFPVLTYDPMKNILAHVIAIMKESLFPENVSLIQTHPGQVFFAQIQVSLTVGIIFSIPLTLKKYWDL